MNSENEVNELFSKFWNWRLENSPEFGTFCGFHEHDDKLESYSSDILMQRKVTAQEFIDEATRLSKCSDLSVEIKENLGVLSADLSIYLKGFSAKGYFFPISYLDGPHLEFERLISAMKYDTLEDYQKLLTRFAALPKQISEIIGMLKASIEEKLTYYIDSVATIPDQLELLLAQKKNPKESVFYKPFLNLPDSIPNSKKESLLSAALDLISDNIFPAFTAMKDFLEKEYFKHVRLQPGISSLPKGNVFYQLCLDFHLGFHLTPKEIHELGLTEVARISKEIGKVMQSLDHEKKSFKDFTEHLRTDQSFYFENPDDLITSYRDLVFQKIQPKLKDLFKNIPDIEVIIKPVPEAMTNAPMAFYLAGTADGRRPGVFYVNDKDVKSAPKYQMTALALHEAVPGHHLQQSYLFSSEGLPNFRKYNEDRKYSEAPSRFPLHSSYVEGWGLYSEYLGSELELYEDKYDYFGYLSQEIFRAARLVVDTGLHELGWNQETAVCYMLENTASSIKDIENEVKRYITWPGQACAYKIGELKIKSLRNQAEKELGSKFNIQDFHEVVLNYCGPLDVLEKKVLEFIDMNRDIKSK